MLRRFPFALLIAVLLPAPAWATPAAFHLMKVVEVFPGTVADPNAQYVVLQMYAGGQNFVNGHSVVVYDAAGAVIQSFPFTANVANGANQAKILIATTQAATFFGVTADLTMSPVIPAAGGKICFDGIDCVAWGNYTGASTGVGTPFNGTRPPDCPAPGIVPGTAAVRRLDIFGSSTTLDSGDDTDNSANDFVQRAPTPRNNANQNGIAPASTCGNGVIQGLEECDDNNTTGGDGCSGLCVIECSTTDVPGSSEWTGRLAASPVPFREQVAVAFTLPIAGSAQVGVHDVSGRLVRLLHRGTLAAGPNRIVWDGRDDGGAAVRSGLYFVRLRAPGIDLRTTIVRSR